MGTYLERFRELKTIPEFVDCVSDEQYKSTEKKLKVFQMNIGRKCNLVCKHCHVGAGPERTEMMSRQTMEACLTVCREKKVPTIDITGGAPEMNEHFRWLVEEARKICDHVIIRSNLVVMTEKGYEDLPEFYANNHVEIVCSLPYYKAKEMERQRGRDTFEPTIEVLKKLNALGYGKGNGLILNMMYNPGGAFLAPVQKEMEKEYKYRLWNEHGIVFDQLFTMTNNPIGRFGDFLEQSDNFEDYMERLYNAFNENVIPNMMCRMQISVRWDGKLYDCDFNQAVDLPITTGECIEDWIGKTYSPRKIQFDKHCFACTAGSGSSCGGAIE